MLAGIVAAMAALGAISKSDAEVRAASNETYCQGVTIWRAEALRGIAPERRAGQPDYAGNAATRCDDLPTKIYKAKRQQLASY